MSKKEKKTKSLPIVSINSISLQSYLYNNNSISFHKLSKSSSNKEFYISYLHTKDIISGVVEVSRRLSDDDIDDAVELEAYESLGLDSAVEYKIIHLETETNSTKSRLFNVFAFDSELINKSFEQVRSKTKYIDYITAAPFLISSLYDKSILDSDKVDCFIYFQKEDAFFAAYKNGKYLYSKSLNYSLLQINEKFCELLGERIDEDTFFELLSTEGLKTSDVSHQQYLMQLFSDIFLYINDVIVFFKRSYDIESIDNIYIGSELGIIEGMLEYSKSYLGIETHNFEFNIAKNKTELQIDQMHVLMVLTAQLYQETHDESLNLTTFKRPPSFSKRPSGVITITVILALLASLAYPLYQFGMGLYLNLDTKAKKKKFIKVQEQANMLRGTIARLTAQKDQVSKLLSAENEKLDFRKKILLEIHEKKVNYPMKGVILDDLANLINDRNIRVASINSQEDNVTISLRSSSDKQLTELLEDISKTGRYTVNTKEIVKLKKINQYESNVTTGVLR